MVLGGFRSFHVLVTTDASIPKILAYVQTHLMKKQHFSLKNPVLNLRRNDGVKTNDMYLEVGECCSYNRAKF